jgi:hypothetical protein
MTTQEAISKYSKEHLHAIAEWYNWKINDSRVPKGVKLIGNNMFEKNHSLKFSLHQEWVKAKTLEEKRPLIQYYIKIWGGIRGNAPSKINTYNVENANDLIRYGKKGIASWSKALVLHNPKHFAIYDARVSVSINVLQILYNVENIKLFPLLPSQNKKVIDANKRLKTESISKGWEIASPDCFYEEYLEILKAIADENNSDVATIEMLLFATTEDLIRNWESQISQI